jgi:hypothetical protein
VPATDLALVGVDACILIAAIEAWNEPPRRMKRRGFAMAHPAVVIVKAASQRFFKLYLVDAVLQEVRAAFHDEPTKLEQLEGLLQRCNIVHCPSPSKASMDHELKSLRDDVVGKLTHLNDACIAVSIRLASVKPDIFVSSNSSHWTPEVSERIGGVQVAKMVPFAEELQRSIHEAATSP